ncbi:arrestin domain-containing protein 3-like [Poecilia reticulata]|uniref:arrestin domain-containing protein 3-like n=1 Tax=Poecilia reticulata TaxID=8081 RepID=UPI0007E96B86|nr:PREDICTED: arrestin domain-containing protein 3-like [Poecilia reticulata]
MFRINDLRIICEDANRDGPFSEGDTVTGLVSFNLSKQTKVKSVSVKLKGDGQVHWTEGSGDDERSYSASKRYLKVKEYLVMEKTEGSVLPQGTNQFMFRLRIPQEDLPSSFKGISGSIVYKVEAQICRKWHLDSTVKKEIQFLSRSIQNTRQVVCPQSNSVIKKMGVFSKGEVQMTASVNKSFCFPGGTLSAFAKISNGSSKSMKPKFSLLQRIVYIAGGSKNISEKSLCKKVGDAIKPNSEETVSCTIDVPPDAIYTLNNCDLISVEYYLKVYLDISFAFDPVVAFPLIIAPAVALDHCEDLGPYPGGPAGAQSYSDFSSAAVYPSEFNPVPISTGAFGYPTLEDQPPLYSSLFPDGQGTTGKSEPVQKS